MSLAVINSWHCLSWNCKLCCTKTTWNTASCSSLHFSRHTSQPVLHHSISHNSWNFWLQISTSLELLTSLLGALWMGHHLLEGGSKRFWLYSSCTARYLGLYSSRYRQLHFRSWTWRKLLSRPTLYLVEAVCKRWGVCLQELGRNLMLKIAILEKVHCCVDYQIGFVVKYETYIIW